MNPRKARTMNEGEMQVLEREVERLRTELRDATERLDAARREAAPFHVGDMVEALLGGEWVQAIVRSVKCESWSTWYGVSPRKKSGEWSARERHAFDCVRALGEHQ